MSEVWRKFLNYYIVMLKLFGIFVMLIDVIITLCICACLYACVCVHANCSVLEYMMKSNVINCQHSLYAMMAVSGAQRAALWSYYGNRFRGAYHFLALTMNVAWQVLLMVHFIEYREHVIMMSMTAFSHSKIRDFLVITWLFLFCDCEVYLIVGGGGVGFGGVFCL